MKPNTNILYYFSENDRETKRIANILNKYTIQFVPIKVVESKIDEKFIELMLEFCQNGFEDIVKNFKKLDVPFDIEDLKYSELVALIVENPQKYLKPAWFLGKSGGGAVITSKGIEDEFTIYIKYKEREMAKIYG
jgi:arsenate reductase-like glutaredoxin family protein